MNLSCKVTGGNYPSVILCTNLFSAMINSQRTLKNGRQTAEALYVVVEHWQGKLTFTNQKIQFVLFSSIQAALASRKLPCMYSFLNTKYAYETGNVIFARFLFVVPVCMNVFRFLTPPLHHFSNGPSPQVCGIV